MRENLEFNPQPFSKGDYEKYKGEEIWEHLKSDTARYLMLLATDCEKPAVIGIDKYLTEKLGEDALFGDNVRQMVGRMVRQLMEHYGYKLYQEDVGCPKFSIFKTGALYSKK